jgi:3-oxoacyl-[acyl-carrier-protein] synthase I
MSTALPVIAELVDWEAVTSLGESATETSYLWEAGIINLAPSRFVLDDGARVALCSSPAVSPHVIGVDRLSALAYLALQRLVSKLEGPMLQGVSTVLLCLSERFALQSNGHKLNDEGKALVKLLSSNLAALGLSVVVEVFPFGRAAGALALQRAAELLATGRRVLWGGVDSQYDWAVLDGLACVDRLLTPDNVDGIRPGEAAAFALLQLAEDSAHPKILGLGMGRQDMSQVANRADGLAQAIRMATSPLRKHNRRCGYWLTDRTHEVITTQSLQHVLTVCGDIVGLSTALHAPLQGLGDTGAATLPLFAALAGEAWRHGSADDDTALLAACSEDGACGAFLISAANANTKGLI